MRTPTPLLATLWLCLSGCSEEPAQAADAYEGEVPPVYVSELKGNYDVWQDGEGGLSCEVALGDGRTIGGYTLEADESCTEKLTLAGDPQAWMIRDDGQLVIIDATRQVLLSMHRLPDGTYKDPRDGDYVNAVLLTPR